MSETKNTSLPATMLRLGVILLAVAAAVALVLGLVNAMTASRIETLNEQTRAAAMQQVLSAGSYRRAAEEYPELADRIADVDDVYIAYYGDGTFRGWVVEVTEVGSQGTITMFVGVDSSYTCTGLSITDSSETAGLGAIASQQSAAGEAFRAQFVGQSGEVLVTKDGGSVDALAGATITSRAVCSGVTAAIDACRALMS